MGWLPVILLVLAIVAALYPFFRKDKGAFQFLAAALLLALAGYSWQGKPGQAGSPKAAEAPREVGDDDFAILHPDLLGRFDRAYAWMQLADADRREGNPLGSAQILESAVRANPRSYALWTAYAYALVAVSTGPESPTGMMSPASQLAFERAYQLAPNHPAPMFFYGLALARSGNWDQAEQVWRQQLQNLGSEYPNYRAAVEERLAAIRQARSTGMPVAPATPPPPQNGQAAPGAPPGAPPGGGGKAPAPARDGNSVN
ncbi:tetratricopeptide repeat protein [Allosphingosinicella sp.]|uniref:tetratricopeptide repeat protein n=1 Tax=Allosphingosinicella sp. TaxID=2823234 RepID=UPI003784E1B6